MPMTRGEHIRFGAARILSIASSNAPATLHEIAVALRIHESFLSPALRLARRTLACSVGAGNWREARAEAEARLRCRERRAAS